MSKVRHPAFPDVVKEVADVGEWVASGWVEISPSGDLPPGPVYARNETGAPEILETSKPKRRRKPRGKD